MNSKMTINDIIEKYYLSSDFNMLADKTKADYRYFLSILSDTNTTLAKPLLAKSVS